MSIESEFRICSRLVLLDHDFNDRHLPRPPEYLPSTWVKLLEPPTPFSWAEALLLCQCSDELWLAWIPDYGEHFLTLDEFYPLSAA
jgi:hypothetical protein